MIVTDDLIARARHSLGSSDPAERAAAGLWLRMARKQKNEQRIFRAVRTHESTARRGT